MVLSLAVRSYGWLRTNVEVGGDILNVEVGGDRLNVEVGGDRLNEIV